MEKKVFDYKNNKHKVKLKNAFQYTLGADEHCLILLIWGQFRVKKYIGRCHRPAGGGLGSENGDLALNGDRVSI